MDHSNECGQGDLRSAKNFEKNNRSMRLHMSLHEMFIVHISLIWKAPMRAPFNVKQSQLYLYLTAGFAHNNCDSALTRSRIEWLDYDAVSILTAGNGAYFRRSKKV